MPVLVDGQFRTRIGVLLSGDGGTLSVAHSNAHVVSIYNDDTLPANHDHPGRPGA